MSFAHQISRGYIVARCHMCNEQFWIGISDVKKAGVMCRECYLKRWGEAPNHPWARRLDADEEEQFVKNTSTSLPHTPMSKDLALEIDKVVAEKGYTLREVLGMIGLEFPTYFDMKRGREISKGSIATFEASLRSIKPKGAVEQDLRSVLKKNIKWKSWKGMNAQKFSKESGLSYFTLLRYIKGTATPHKRSERKLEDAARRLGWFKEEKKKVVEQPMIPQEKESAPVKEVKMEEVKLETGDQSRHVLVKVNIELAGRMIDIAPILKHFQ
jgi:hypothetical protein